MGTFLFLYIAFAGTQTAFGGQSKLPIDIGPELTQLLYVALTFGFSLAVNVWVLFRISGGLFNSMVSALRKYSLICHVVEGIELRLIFMRIGNTGIMSDRRGASSTVSIILLYITFKHKYLFYLIPAGNIGYNLHRLTVELFRTI
jgi:hypothetical protein